MKLKSIIRSTSTPFLAEYSCSVGICASYAGGIQFDIPPGVFISFFFAVFSFVLRRHVKARPLIGPVIFVSLIFHLSLNSLTLIGPMSSHTRQHFLLYQVQLKSTRYFTSFHVGFPYVSFTQWLPLNLEDYRFSGKLVGLDCLKPQKEFGLQRAEGHTTVVFSLSMCNNVFSPHSILAVLDKTQITKCNR